MNVELMLLTVLQGLRTRILDAVMLFFTHLGDAGLIWAALTALWLAGKKQWALAALPLGVLIAFSRMYLFVHYPTDILGGVLVGVGCGWMGAKLAEMFWQKNFAKSDL